jgi:ABC-type enterochelin transport system permease subunit
LLSLICFPEEEFIFGEGTPMTVLMPTPNSKSYLSKPYCFKNNQKKQNLCAQFRIIREVRVMVKKILFISLALFGLLFSTMTKECFADASGQGITAIAPDPAGLVAHYEFEGDAADTSIFQP